MCHEPKGYIQFIGNNLFHWSELFAESDSALKLVYDNENNFSVQLLNSPYFMFKVAESAVTLSTSNGMAPLPTFCTFTRKLRGIEISHRKAVSTLSYPSFYADFEKWPYQWMGSFLLVDRAC